MADISRAQGPDDWVSYRRMRRRQLQEMLIQEQSRGPRFMKDSVRFMRSVDWLRRIGAGDIAPRSILLESALSYGFSVHLRRGLIRVFYVLGLGILVAWMALIITEPTLWSDKSWAMRLTGGTFFVVLIAVSWFALQPITQMVIGAFVIAAGVSSISARFLLSDSLPPDRLLTWANVLSVAFLSIATAGFPFIIGASFQRFISGKANGRVLALYELIEAAIIARQALDLVEQKPGSVNISSNWRLTLSQHLDTASILAYRGVKEEVAYRNPILAREYESYCNKLRSHILGLSYKLLSSTGPGAVREGVYSLEATITALLTYREGELASRVEPLGSPLSRKQQVTKLVKLLVVGAIPFAALAVLGIVSAVVPGEVWISLVIFACVWAAICLITLLDPSMLDRLQAAQSLMGALRGGGDKK